MDVRYHLASLIGVFFALGLGILIGASINGDGRLLQEQAGIIDTIESQLGQLRDEKTRLNANLTQVQAELEAYKRYAQESLPRLVSGRLDGFRVALVGLNEERLTKEVQTTLEHAGAVIGGIVHLSEIALLQRGGLLAATGQLDPRLTEMLTAAFTGRSAATSSGTWEGVRWAQPVQGAADCVVVVSNDHSTDLLRRVAGALQQDGLAVTAVAAGTGWSKPVKAQGLATVEDVARPAGMLALIELLAGEHAN